MSTMDVSSPAPAVEKQGWVKSLTWRDGFSLALPIAGGAFVSSGYAVGALGAWGAFMIFAIMCGIAILSNFLFSEMAAMFPNHPGSLSLYSRIGMRRFFAPAGVIGAFGYWCGYAIAVAFIALQVGILVQMQWFSDVTWSVAFAGMELTLAHFIGIGLLLVCWFLSVLGIRVAARISTVVGIVMTIVIAIVIIGPLVTGKFSTANLEFQWPGWTGLLVWFYIAGWTAYVSEITAVFAPEYKNTKRDTPKALLAAGMFLMIVYVFTPFTATGVLGGDVMLANPITYGPMAAAEVFGGGSAIFTAILVATQAVTVLVFMADSSRATAGMAEEGITIKQLKNLNRRGEPVWGLAVVAIVCIGIVLFASNPLAIILASNLGYILSHALAVFAFLALRRAYPDAPRPIKLPRIWIPIAAAIGLFDVVILVAGALNPGLAGYGGVKETLIGLGILLLGIVFWAYRVLVQDRARLSWRDTAQLQELEEPAS